MPESEQGMMSAVPTMRRDDPADDDLAGTWAWLFGTALGRPVRLLAFRREPCQFATLFPAERVSLVLDTGREVSLFVKHMGGEQADHPDKRRRDRETLVYEELLAGDHDLPVARYYGTRLNRATGRREVYLEFVDDWSLKYHGLEHWFAAARALARLHARFATRAPRLAACDFLLRLDEQYLRAWAERALVAVARKSAGLAARLRRLLDEYGRAAGLMARQPATLVHNDLSPKNVIADRSSTPARTCFIDWELAGVGCGLLDLVHLKYGLDPASDRKLVDAYRGELRGTDLLPADERDFERLLAACELHKTLYRLAHCDALGSTASTVAQWVADATTFSERL